MFFSTHKQPWSVIFHNFTRPTDGNWNSHLLSKKIGNIQQARKKTEQEKNWPYHRGRVVEGEPLVWWVRCRRTVELVSSVEHWRKWRKHLQNVRQLQQQGRVTTSSKGWEKWTSSGGLWFRWGEVTREQGLQRAVEWGKRKGIRG